MPNWVRKSFAHCSRLVVAGPAGVVAVVEVVAVVLTPVASRVDWACASAFEKFDDCELDDEEVEGDGDCSNIDWISAIRA
jgi:hypothetical protein